MGVGWGTAKPTPAEVPARDRHAARLVEARITFAVFGAFGHLTHDDEQAARTALAKLPPEERARAAEVARRLADLASEAPAEAPEQQSA